LLYRFRRAGRGQSEPLSESYICLVRIDSQQGLCQHKGGWWMRMQPELANLNFSTLASKLYRSPRYEFAYRDTPSTAFILNFSALSLLDGFLRIY
jgi:hypothetical protein